MIGEVTVEGTGVFVIVVFSLLIVAGLAVMWMAMTSRRQIREMEHRERLAMIERGLAPPPELDPIGFEAATHRPVPDRRVSRSHTAGIMMMGIGFAFMFLVAFAGGAPEVGVGVGAACAVLGAAFFANGFLLRRMLPPAPPPPVRRPDPRAPFPPPPEA
jgi:hypothetical protein